MTSDVRILEQCIESSDASLQNRASDNGVTLMVPMPETIEQGGPPHRGIDIASVVGIQHEFSGDHSFRHAPKPDACPDNK